MELGFLNFFDHGFGLLGLLWLFWWLLVWDDLNIDGFLDLLCLLSSIRSPSCISLGNLNIFLLFHSLLNFLNLFNIFLFLALLDLLLRLLLLLFLVPSKEIVKDAKLSRLSRIQ